MAEAQTLEGVDDPHHRSRLTGTGQPERVEVLLSRVVAELEGAQDRDATRGLAPRPGRTLGKKHDQSSANVLGGIGAPARRPDRPEVRARGAHEEISLVSTTVRAN